MRVFLQLIVPVHCYVWNDYFHRSGRFLLYKLFKIKKLAGVIGYKIVIEV